MVGDISLNTSLAYIKGVGPRRAELLTEQLEISTVEDWLHQLPRRYIDRTKINSIASAQVNEYMQIKARVRSKRKHKMGKVRTRLEVIVDDGSGKMQLNWYQSADYFYDQLAIGSEFFIFGIVKNYKNQLTMSHPDLHLAINYTIPSELTPIYASTEKLDNSRLTVKFKKEITKAIFSQLDFNKVTETLSPTIMKIEGLLGLSAAYKAVHLPTSYDEAKKGRHRLKYEELFYVQLGLLMIKNERDLQLKGHLFEVVGENFNTFYHNHLPFELTNAQKKVIREIRVETITGIQMNRLLQGDVGSGKTIVAVLVMLIALDNGFQATLMAPTEILAFQHLHSIQSSLSPLGLTIDILTGSIKGKRRTKLLSDLEDGKIDILIGTHALIEKTVKFKNLGLAIIDEQHRFGVEQRSKLWLKSKLKPPHILVMTATPIPRTLAMTFYGDLSLSVIDELPPGRKDIKTLHLTDHKRPELINFVRNAIKKGQQVYIVYPLIEESEKLDLKNLFDGYERLRAQFPPPEFQISVLHGRMPPKDKEFEMQRFVEKKTQIMMATTVIEVGVNVPNASIMIIEDANRFGLSQLHQLRGRVGRGSQQSFCILMTMGKLTQNSKKRIATMCNSNDGFHIAEVDMEIRGYGNIQGTQQSGVMKFKFADLDEDQDILISSRAQVQKLLKEDPTLSNPKHRAIRKKVTRVRELTQNWGRIS